ncbi:MAG: hypothetical protein NTW65_13370 [Deltaproteobacteria bacterium]|nr:hypothetical protein [Deltaproteobacteria bacterium]
MIIATWTNVSDRDIEVGESFEEYFSQWVQILDSSGIAKWDCGPCQVIADDSPPNMIKIKPRRTLTKKNTCGLMCMSEKWKQEPGEYFLTPKENYSNAYADPVQPVKIKIVK